MSACMTLGWTSQNEAILAHPVECTETCIFIINKAPVTPDCMLSQPLLPFLYASYVRRYLLMCSAYAPPPAGALMQLQQWLVCIALIVKEMHIR
jgi:hypothetical protein